MRQLLSGNEALAHGAWESGVLVAAGYPGTPSTEILETLAPMPGVRAEWCPNEKVALDVAVGAAYAGVRAMAVMKHVGLNVAADSLFYAALTGAEAGLVVVVADDPGMHSSQGEQDSRRFAKFARVPCLEPSNSQEARDMAALAFELSEAFDTPVMLRTTTRIAHSCGIVTLNGTRRENSGERRYRIDAAKYVMVPAFARQRRPLMEARMARLAGHAEHLAENRWERRSHTLGIVTHGVAYTYAREVFPEASILRLGMTHPIPIEMARSFARSVERLLVIEELDPVIEEELRVNGIPCEGKSIFPMIGELDPQVVRASAQVAGLLPAGHPAATPRVADLPARPPVLCPGCPHRAVYAALRRLKVVINGDIGCYTLGFLPPLSAVHTTGCMGAGIGVAHGVAMAGVTPRNVAVIGDSTFLHSGMPALLNIAYNGGNTLTIILDNRTTAMTGHQDHAGTGRTLQGQPSVEIDLEALVRALGIRYVWTVDPYRVSELESRLESCLELDGPSVVIARRACALIPGSSGRQPAMRVDDTACTGCGVCLTLGCPSISLQREGIGTSRRAVARIDPLLCAGCGVCAHTCPNDCIAPRDASS